MPVWIKIWWESFKTGLHGTAGSAYVEDPDEYIKQLNEKDDGFVYGWEWDDGDDA